MKIIYQRAPKNVLSFLLYHWLIPASLGAREITAFMKRAGEQRHALPHYMDSGSRKVILFENVYRVATIVWSLHESWYKGREAKINKINTCLAGVVSCPFC